MSLIVVSGAIANKLYQGGEAWVRLSYVLGLRRLGYQVRFIEQISRDSCVDADGHACDFELSANLTYFNNVMAEFGLADCAMLVPTDRNGGARVDSGLVDLVDSAEALLNISGHLTIEPLFNRLKNRTLVDIDPGYTQYWRAQGLAGARIAGHDRFFTIGENIGTKFCSIPTGGLMWWPTRPPVVLDQWPVSQSLGSLRFTTVANWRGAFGPVEFEGKRFGLKAHEFRKNIELPSRVPARFDLALNIHPADHKDTEALKQQGWNLVDPRLASTTPEVYRNYIQESSAEFSVAQGIYVDTQCGWFSDRTTRYLASGKPALVQDTGFSRFLPTGKGLIAFKTLDEACQGAEDILADYETHCRAARAIAEEHFDSGKVLSQMMQLIGVEP